MDILQPDLTKIPDFIELVDKECKTDLDRNLIVSERDYLSCFSVLIRKPLGVLTDKKLTSSDTNKLILGETSNASQNITVGTIYLAGDIISNHLVCSYTLPQDKEQYFGADQVMLFIIKNVPLTVKIVMIEGKLIKAKFRWDKKQKTENISHFIHQLNRQIKNKDTGIYFIEMFIHKFTEEQDLNGLKFPKNITGSDFVELDNIKELIDEKRESLKLNQKDYVDFIQKSRPINEIITDVLLCNIGKPFNINSSTGSIQVSLSTEEIIDFPIISSRDYIKDEFIEKVNNFMNTYGIRSYTIFNINTALELSDEKLKTFKKVININPQKDI